MISATTKSSLVLVLLLIGQESLLKTSLSDQFLFIFDVFFPPSSERYQVLVVVVDRFSLDATLAVFIVETYPSIGVVRIPRRTKTDSLCRWIVPLVPVFIRDEPRDA